MALTDLYTLKQIEIYKRCRQSDWFMLINHGAKRSGKTVLNNDLFLSELIRVRKTATELGIDTPQYILAGATLGTISKNILVELNNKYGIEFKFDKFNSFMLFGVQVVQVGHSTIQGLAAIRGMTAFGAYINEASLAHEEVFDEIKSRCSGEGARILVDTNPDHPEHWLLKDYILNNSTNIISYQFKLSDNTFLSKRYVDNIIESTPSGMFYSRNIDGEWVSGDGVIYQDFNKDIHYVKNLDGIKFKKYIAGVDWGYKHFGAIVVIGISDDDKYYLVKEIAEQFQEIDFWVSEAQKIKAEYGNMTFYCDSARPEYVTKFNDCGLKAVNADKAVLSGIESVAKLYKSSCLYILESAVKRFREEIYMYIWDKNTGNPVKVFDDVQDAIRYAIYSYKAQPKAKVGNKSRLGLR